MATSFGRKRTILPPSNVGVSTIAERRVAEAATRAALRTSEAVRVDAHLCRVWLRQPRATFPCPCSGNSSNGAVPSQLGSSVILPPNEGDYENQVDSGFPPPKLTPSAGEDVGDESVDAPRASSYLEDITRLLFGNGRRCGLCWGTGWLDGHRLWGGVRVLACVADTLYCEMIDDQDAMIDVDAQTPTFVGPCQITWNVDVPSYVTILDALRVRNGLSPATGSFILEARTSADAEGVWRDALEVFGLIYGNVPGYSVPEGALDGLQLRLTLGRGDRASHVELVLRSESLVHLQLPQLQQAASAELIAPMFSQEFEVDPLIGSIERGTLFEVPGVSGSVGALWIVTDVTAKRTARGQIWGITGNARNAQPTDVVSAALLDDSNIGIVDPGVTPRGLEAQSGGDPAGPDGRTDDSLPAAKQGSQPRHSGGERVARPSVIILSRGDEYADDDV